MPPERVLAPAALPGALPFGDDGVGRDDDNSDSDAAAAGDKLSGGGGGGGSSGGGGPAVICGAQGRLSRADMTLVEVDVMRTAATETTTAWVWCVARRAAAPADPSGRLAWSWVTIELLPATVACNDAPTPIALLFREASSVC